MINPQWLELPVSRTNFHGPKGVWALKFDCISKYQDRQGKYKDRQSKEDFIRTATKFIRTASSEKVSSNTREMRRFRSFCACAKYYLGISSSFIDCVISHDINSRQRRVWSDRGCLAPRICPKARFRLARPIFSFLFFSDSPTDDWGRGSFVEV